MLEFIRNRAKGWLAWVIIGLITVPFALWGIHNYIGGGGTTYVAKVAGQEIAQSHFDNTYQQQRQQLEQMFGGQIPDMFSEQMLRAQVLEQMIEQEVVIQAALGLGMRISDRQLANVIRSVDAFHEDGVFSQERYLNLLARQGMTPTMFEQRVRRDLLAEQLESGFSGTAFVTPQAIDAFIRLDRQQRSFEWLRVKASDFIAQLRITEADIQAWYESNAARYQTPEQVKLDYLEIRAEQFVDMAEVEEDELRMRYEARIEQYRSPEERRASHILVRLQEGASDAAIRASREKAEALLARIRSGEDFATLASSESDDPGSAASGGDLGYFSRGMMVASFEDVAFVMEPDQLSELVRSPFGFHIIRLDDVRGGELTPYEAVRDDLYREVKQERAERLYYEMAERLANYTYEQQDSLSVAAEELGLPIQTTDFITRQGGAGIAANPRVLSAAFSDELLNRRINSDPLEITREHTVVVRVKEHRAAAVRPLDEVRDSIVAALHQQRSSELAREQAASLLTGIEQGTPMADFAAQTGVSIGSRQVIQRDSDGFEPDVIEAVFAMPHPASGGYTSQLLGLGNGDQLVLVLHEVVDADPAEADAAQREQVAQLLRRVNAITSSEAMLASIREKTDITIRR
ncbi:MAG: SurA N-terminal domain-containing protein [Chromatiales bacterium]|nr:SurA N-terminal domain-containing protein [Gammaproteobacteria bacterium]MBW6476119.1 SurA N-terminal domain-containing protein [Chromatiales bacterium]